jgi:hypothetical protein
MAVNACYYGKGDEVFEFLCGLGIDFSTGLYTNPSFTALSVMVTLPSRYSKLNSMRTLIHHCDEAIHITEQEMIHLLSDFVGTVEEFRFLQRELCPEYYRMPQWMRTTIAIRALHGYYLRGSRQFTPPELIHSMLGSGPQSCEDIQFELTVPLSAGQLPWLSTSLLHAAAKNIARVKALQ